MNPLLFLSLRHYTEGLVFNAIDACAKLGINSSELDTIWGKAKKAGDLVKFGGGFYCGFLKVRRCRLTSA